MLHNSVSRPQVRNLLTKDTRKFEESSGLASKCAPLLREEIAAVKLLNFFVISRVDLQKLKIKPGRWSFRGFTQVLRERGLTQA